VKVGRVRLNPSLDLYNLLNASPILGVNTRYGPSWLTPTQILPGRLFKFGAQVTF
jgi:outer membrane receptor protein involved in Fe transport